MRFAAWILATSFSCVCAAAPPDAQVAMSVEFQDCLAGRQQTFFRLDFLPDGAVVFEGKDEVREKGTRVARIGEQRVQQLVRSAAKAVSPGAPQAETSGYKQRPPFCLKIKVGGGDSTLTGNVSPEDRPGKKLHRQLLRYLDLQTWVCPTRGWAPLEMAHCDSANIVFNFGERENCDSSHVVSLWMDGRVHYYRYGVAGSDRYYKVDRGVVARLFRLGSRYGGDLVFTHMPPDRRNRYLLGSEMLIEYKQTLSGLARVPWEPLPVHSNCASDYGEYPRGALSLRR
jgi:hypothetical protein